VVPWVEQVESLIGKMAFRLMLMRLLPDIMMVGLRARNSNPKHKGNVVGYDEEQ